MWSILGSYTALPGNGDKRIRLDVRVQDTVRGETIVERSFTGNEGNLFELATEAGQALGKAWELPRFPAKPTFRRRLLFPPTKRQFAFIPRARNVHGHSTMYVRAIC